MASDLFGVPADRIGPASSPQTIETWDSIQHLNLVLALEERFGLQLSPEEIEQISGVATLGIIPRINSAEDLSKALTSPRSPLSASTGS